MPNSPGAVINSLRGIPFLAANSEDRNSITTGNIWYVSSTHANTQDATDHGHSPLLPFATLDYAIGRATANNGDTIYVMPNHAETLSAASAVLFDVAGIKVIGLGTGDDRPTFSFNNTAGEVQISAANTEIANCVFVGNVASQTLMLDIDASGDGSYIHHNTFREGSSTALNFVTISGVADDVRIEDNEFYAPTAGNLDDAISINAAATRLSIKRNFIYGDFDDAGIASGSAFLNSIIADNAITNLLTGQHAIELTAAATGMIVNNRLSTDTVGATGALDPGSMRCIGNLWNNTGDFEGTPPLPIVDSATNFLGVDDADNLADTTNVVANRDGSVLERLEHILDALVDDETTNLIGFDDANNAAATTNVVANQDGSLVERAEQLQQLAAMAGFYNSANYLSVTADFTSATWNTVAAHEIATVTGAVRMLILPECTATVISTGTNASFVLGDETNTSSLIAASLLDGLATGEWWVDATITRTIATRTQMNALEFVVANGKDIGYTISVNAATTGSIVFHMWWVAINATGAVAAGAGGVL